MRRSPLFRLFASVLALVVAANAVLAGRPHGCAAGPSGAPVPVEVAAAAGHAAHSGAAHHPEQPVPAECDCVSHACCSSAALAVLSGDGALLLRRPEAATTSGWAALPYPPVPPPHRLPFPLGPPALVS